jgi:predicted secreted protein
MAAQPLFAKGTKLKRKNPSTGNYEDIPHCTVLNTPQPQFDEEEVSDHDSTGNAKEFMQGMFDPGRIPVTLTWNPDIPLHVTLYNDMTTNVARDWQIVLPNGSQTTFAGQAFLRNLGGSLEFNRAVRFSGELRCTGLWTLT